MGDAKGVSPIDVCTDVRVHRSAIAENNYPITIGNEGRMQPLSLGMCGREKPCGKAMTVAVTDFNVLNGLSINLSTYYVPISKGMQMKKITLFLLKILRRKFIHSSSPPLV